MILCNSNGCEAMDLGFGSDFTEGDKILGIALFLYFCEQTDSPQT
ncbi:MAG: hypothetical protein ABIK93_00420 [candidate division WOR-3 bacterium]